MDLVARRLLCVCVVCVCVCVRACVCVIAHGLWGVFVVLGEELDGRESSDVVPEGGLEA